MKKIWNNWGLYLTLIQVPAQLITTLALGVVGFNWIACIFNGLVVGFTLSTCRYIAQRKIRS